MGHFLCLWNQPEILSASKVGGVGGVGKELVEETGICPYLPYSAGNLLSLLPSGISRFLVNSEQNSSVSVCLPVETVLVVWLSQ